MTRQKSFKRLVRARMDKTGESYSSARTALLAHDDADAGEAPALTMSDDAIRRRTGHGWEHWFDLLDEWGATERSHTEAARWLQQEHDTGGWNSQSIVVSYERARGGRAVGEHADGFTVTASKTVAVPVEELYEAFVDEELRRRWLPDAELRERTATPPRSARFDWGDTSTRIVVGFETKPNGKSVASLAHEKLPDAAEAERLKAYWRERVAVLKQVLEA